jgi:hypothetical protein
MSGWVRLFPVELRCDWRTTGELHLVRARPTFDGVFGDLEPEHALDVVHPGDFDPVCLPAGFDLGPARRVPLVVGIDPFPTRRLTELGKPLDARTAPLAELRGGRVCEPRPG